MTVKDEEFKYKLELKRYMDSKDRVDWSDKLRVQPDYNLHWAGRLKKRLAKYLGIDIKLSWKIPLMRITAIKKNNIDVKVEHPIPICLTRQKWSEDHDRHRIEVKYVFDQIRSHIEDNQKVLERIYKSLIDK